MIYHENGCYRNNVLNSKKKEALLGFFFMILTPRGHFAISIVTIFRLNA